MASLLSVELLECIGSFCDASTLVKLAKSSPQFSAVFSQDSLWKRRFPVVEIPRSISDNGTLKHWILSNENGECYECHKSTTHRCQLLDAPMCCYACHRMSHISFSKSMSEWHLSPEELQEIPHETIHSGTYFLRDDVLRLTRTHTTAIQSRLDVAVAKQNKKTATMARRLADVENLVVLSGGTVDAIKDILVRRQIEYYLRAGRDLAVVERSIGRYFLMMALLEKYELSLEDIKGSCLERQQKWFIMDRHNEFEEYLSAISAGRSFTDLSLEHESLSQNL